MKRASDTAGVPWTRRDFLLAAAAAAALPARAPCGPTAAPTPAGASLLFTSQGRTGVVDLSAAPSPRIEFLDFDVPGQATWQPAGVSPDGREILFLSMAPRRDGPGRPFDEFYHQTPTRLWLRDARTGRLREICQKDRLAPFYAPCLMLAGGRILVQIVRRGGGQVVNMDLDGGDVREFTRPDEGLPYGFSLSPGGDRVAFHLAGPAGYQVWTSDVWGRQRRLLAGADGRLYFGTAWSPGGEWVAYVDCLHRDDPGHDWADVCIGRPDGGEHRVLTQGQAMWFGATYGPPERPGGGSNTPNWTPDGRILFPRRLPGSKTPWEFQPDRPDVDHFNRDYKPDLARGGTEICSLDPKSGAIDVLTSSDPPVWDFRSSASPDGRLVAFCRAATGESPALWVMDADGSNARELTRGLDRLGADHPRWLAPA